MSDTPLIRAIAAELAICVMCETRQQFLRAWREALPHMSAEQRNSEMLPTLTAVRDAVIEADIDDELEATP